MISPAKLKLEASQKQAEALVSRGQADAAVILLKKQAEAEPLRQQVSAFGDGNAYAQYFFFQKVSPAIKTILTNTDGPFADLFKQFTVLRPPAAPVVPATPALKAEDIKEVKETAKGVQP